MSSENDNGPLHDDLIDPTEEQLAALRAGPEGPVQMVNLLKFRVRAEYPAAFDGGQGTGATGEEAYARYAENTLPHVASRGGRLVLLSTTNESVIGDPGDWDQLAIVEYPSRAAFLEMTQDPDYVAGTVHRTAGLLRTTILATSPVIDASNPR